MVKLEIRKNAYFDSVTLMLISKDLKKLDGVKEALQQGYDRQMQKLDEDMAKRKYADFIENTG